MTELDRQIKLLDFCEKTIPRRISRNLYLNRLFSANASFVLGCQRSGTTLLFLMLSSHPNITGLDENYSKNKYPHWPVLCANAFKHKKTLYKLPEQVWSVDYICNQFPKAKIIWIIRNPYAVISSMKSLMFDGENWIQKFGRRELKIQLQKYPEFQSVNFNDLSDIEVATLIWKYKNKLVEEYTLQGVDVLRVYYEQLLSKPERTLKNILAYLQLPWSEAVLEHYKHHKNEIHPGETRADKPLDQSRIKPALNLTAKEMTAIQQVLGEDLNRFGYGTDSNG